MPVNLPAESGSLEAIRFKGYAKVAQRRGSAIDKHPGM
jgi:hypothetical protein